MPDGTLSGSDAKASVAGAMVLIIVSLGYKGLV